MVLLIWKWMGLFLNKNYFLRCWGCLYVLNWIETLRLSLFLKLPPRKLESWFVLWRFFSWGCSVSFPWGCYLELLDKLQNGVCRTVGPSLAASLELLAHRRNVASLSLFYSLTLVDAHLNWQDWFHFVILEGGRCTCYSHTLHDFCVTISRCYRDVYVNSFFPHTARPWNSLPIECFPSTYDLNGFKNRINRHLLTVGSF